MPERSRPVVVLMAVHNGAAFLKDAIESILEQSYGDFSFLVVDDASTDRSREIISSYRDDRIRLLALPRNVGQTAALNIGLRQISSRWVARMDADDFSAPTRLEEQMRTVGRHPGIGCIGTGIWEFREAPSQREAIILMPETHDRIQRAALLGSAMIHGSILVNRDALLEINGYNERYRYASDRDLFLRLLWRIRAMNIPAPLLGIRRHGNQDSFSLAAATEYVEVFSSFLCGNGFSAEEQGILRESLTYSHLFRGRCFWRSGDYFSWAEGIGKAFGICPRVCLRSLAGTVGRRLLPKGWLTRRQASHLGRKYEWS